ncbi:hypothetical protein CWE15_05960 [Aliidiomarina taiwanensis]|uniref:Cobalamin biosynthesis protein CbiB n=1 Tax=Aliidiomarina taiwanensis TaxID=946228 RepID=A0A432X7T7_9GAMM|nr:cobalamin biosynthesis protein [Aliidiomarina taiwanensis]RUO42944.1 hypothetical protein CWE15_05960 [Aliidiomarina taiwanensis]
MESLWQTLIDHEPLVLFLSALILERTLPIPAHLHPFVALRHMALLLAKRVHPSLQRARSQQRISGLLALLLMLLLWFCVPALLYALAELKRWFGAIILWLCLFSQPWLTTATHIQQAVLRKQKQLARSRVQFWLNRECMQLSSLGIEKAASEHTALRLTQAWWGVLFWFVVAGPLAALAYRLVYELRYAWPAEYTHWRDFGAAGFGLFTLVNGLPHALLRMILQLIAKPLRTRSTHTAVPIWSNPFSPHQNMQLFALLTQVFPLALGSPVKYQGKRYPRTRFSHPNAPVQGLIQQSIRHLAYLQCLLFCVVLPAFVLLRY